MLNAYVNIRINLNLPLKVRAQELSADLGNTERDCLERAPGASRDTVLAAPIAARYCFLWSAGLVESGRPLDPHNAQSGIEVYVYVDVQDQAVRPSGERAKLRHGLRAYWNVGSNLDPHVIAVADKQTSHIIDCVGCVSHACSPNRWLKTNITLGYSCRCRVISGHCITSVRCPLYPQKRTLPGASWMSALCQKRTLARLIDYLVGKRE